MDAQSEQREMTAVEVLNYYRDTLDSIVMGLRDLRIPSENGQPQAMRELALAITNLQQGRMWLGEAMREAGLVEPYSNEKVASDEVDTLEEERE